MDNDSNTNPDSTHAEHAVPQDETLDQQNQFEETRDEVSGESDGTLLEAPLTHAETQDEGASAISATRTYNGPKGLGNALPERFGEFRIVKELGRGGMGIVYEAVQESLNRRVAVKTLLKGVAPGSDSRKRFEREARAIARLHHSNIVDVFGNGEDDGIPFFAMRFIEGKGLDEIIRDKLTKASDGEVSAFARLIPTDLQARCRKAAEIGRDIGFKLQYAHDSGVVHRDMKPSNVIIDKSGTVWLTDFGLARLTDSGMEASLTGDGAILGTLRYMPPEALEGPPGAKGDQYSLGLTLYEIVAREPALQAASAPGLMEQIREANPRKLNEVHSGIPRDLATIIHKSIDRNPGSRYETAGDLAADLQRFLNDEPILARPISWFERMMRWSRRNKGLAAALATVATLLVVVAVSGTIAAGYFRHLNTKLSSTVTSLTRTTGQLTDKTRQLDKARLKAIDDATENLRLAKVAEAARNESLDTLSDMQTSRGLMASKQSDWETAALWFASAAKKTPHDSVRQRYNRIRAELSLARCSRPVALFPIPAHPTGFEDLGSLMRVRFQPHGDLLLSVGNSPFRIWNPHPATRPVGLQRSRRARQDAATTRGEAKAAVLKSPESQSFLPWCAEIKDAKDACWLPDGERVAIAMGSGEWQIREIPSGKTLVSQKIGDFAYAVNCSSDGKWLAIGGKTIQLWALTDHPSLKREWSIGAITRRLVFNGKRDRLAAACADSKVRLIDISAPDGQDSPKVLGTYPFHLAKQDAPVFMDDDKYIVTAQGPHIRWWDARTGAFATSTSAPDGHIKHLCSSPDGKWVAASVGKICALLQPGGQSKVISHDSEVYCSQFSPDGQSLLTGTLDWKGRIWTDLKSSPRFRGVPHSMTPITCDFSSDGRLFAFGDHRSIRVWQVPSDQVLQDDTLKTQLASWKVANSQVRLSQDGRLATLGHLDVGPLTRRPELECLECDVGSVCRNRRASRSSHKPVRYLGHLYLLEFEDFGSGVSGR